MSFSVFASGGSKKTVKLSNNKTFPIKFDAVESGSKCGYYDTSNKTWIEDGELDTRTCSFSHLTDFALFETARSTDEEANAYIVWF